MESIRKKFGQSKFSKAVAVCVVTASGLVGHAIDKSLRDDPPAPERILSGAFAAAVVGVGMLAYSNRRKDEQLKALRHRNTLLTERAFLGEPPEANATDAVPSKENIEGSLDRYLVTRGPKRETMH